MIGLSRNNELIPLWKEEALP